VVERQIDISTGTLAVEALFPNPERLLRPGQFAKVRGSAETKHDVVLVPQRAVRELQGSFQVGIVGEDNKVAMRTVAASEQVGSDWIIERGLKGGEKLIVEGLIKVRAGDVVVPEVRKTAAIDDQASESHPPPAATSEPTEGATEPAPAAPPEGH